MAPASSRGGSRRSTPRGVAETIVAPPVHSSDEKKQAAAISGHTWNILNNKEDHEVYLRHARNPDHYLDVASGKTTSFWFERKKRVDLDNDGVIDTADSSNVQEVLTCPGTAGKEDAYLRSRQARQLCQASAPRDYALYTQRRQFSRVPTTPGPREG